MKKEFDYDVIVVGGGPAGLQASFEIASSGNDYRVCLMDRKEDITKVTRACSAQFVMDDDYEGEKIEIEDELIKFTRSGFEVPYRGKLIPIKHNYLVSPNGTILESKREDDKPLAIKFDKQELLEGLLLECVSADVDIRMKTNVTEVKEEKDYVTVKTASGEEYTCKYIVIAEGVQCKLTEQLGFNTRENRKCLGSPMILQYTVEGATRIPHNSWIQYYGNVYHPFTEIMIGESDYSDDALEITVGGMGQYKPADFFEKLRTESPLTSNLRNIEVVKITGCSVDSYLSLEEPCKGRAIILGDAAAHIEVINQGALMCGHFGGLAIVKKLLGINTADSEYNRWWNKAFMFNTKNKMQQLMNYGKINIKARLTDDEIDYLFGLLAKNNVVLPGVFNQYEVPKNFWKEVMNYLEDITEYSQDLYEKVFEITSIVEGM